MKPKVLFIAGLDPSGNAGMIRDIEMACRLGVQANAVATALTAQSRSSFFSSQVVSPAVFRRQLEAVSPLFSFKAIKLGMLGNDKIIRSLVSQLKGASKLPPIVLDPVYESSSGGVLLTKKGRSLLWEKLLPLVSVWTPNLLEASYFLGKPVRTAAQMEAAAMELFAKTGIPAFLKGGHGPGRKVTDLFFDGADKSWFVFRRLKGLKIRGTGCALAGLLACYLALGEPLGNAARLARRQQDAWLRQGTLS